MLERWTLDLAGRDAVDRARSTTGARSSRASTSAVTGRPHRYGYAAALTAARVEHGPALKHDLAAGTSEVHDYGPGRVTLEPLFVPRSPTRPPRR